MALVHPFSPYNVTSEGGKEEAEEKKRESHFYYTSVGTFWKAFMPRKLLFLQTADSLEKKVLMET